MHLLVVGINYDPEIISTGVYTTALAEEMVRQDVTVDVVTALPYYPAWRVFEGWRGPFWRRRRKEGVNIVHCPLYVPHRPTGVRRILHHLSFALSALPVALWKAIRHRPDLVFVVAPGMVSAPSGLLAARLCGAKTWLHIQDYEVEAAFATGLLKDGSTLGRVARAFEARVLRRFDRISSISQPMLDKLTEKQVAQEKIYELRNWANLSRVSRMPVGSSPMKEELGITTRYVALYSGNLANKQGLEILPEIARRLAQRDDLTLLVCGDGPMRETLVTQSEGLDNMRFLPLQPLDRLNDLLAMADVHLLPQIAGAADLVLPSKLTNMLASGRPIIATALPETALGQEVEGAGLLVPPGDGPAAAKALDRLLDDPELRETLGQEARERALHRWDMTAIINRLKMAFLDLTAHPQTGARQNSTTRDKA